MGFANAYGGQGMFMVPHPVLSQSWQGMAGAEETVVIGVDDEEADGGGSRRLGWGMGEENGAGTPVDME